MTSRIVAWPEDWLPACDNDRYNRQKPMTLIADIVAYNV
jgi:hypothetical protein